MDLGLGAARQCSSTRKAVSMATQWEAPTRYHHTELLYGVSIKYHNYNKILKSDWLSTVPISALIGQCNRTARVTLSNWTVCAITHVDLNGFFFSLLAKNSWNFLCFDLNLNITNFVIVMINIGNRTSCRPIPSVIILVINQIRLPRLCLSLVWLQTGLDYTQSYYHYLLMLSRPSSKKGREGWRKTH